jgi:hypothetical protein
VVPPPVVPPPAVPPVPEVPPVPAAAPPVPDPLAGADAAPDPVAELEAGAAAALELAELEDALEDAVLVLLVVVGVVDVLVLAVSVGVAANEEVGIVSAGASALSAAGGALLPQPASVSATTMAAVRQMNRRAAVGPLRITEIMRRRAAPSGARSAGSR